MPHWFAPTHHDHLVTHHGLDPAVMLLVPCACGIEARRADYMVDVTGLPAPVREALGIGAVDYLCDGCTTRLFREQHITQEDFNALLGAPAENLALVRGFDAEHAQAMRHRAPDRLRRHVPVPRDHGTKSAAAPSGTTAPLPLRVREMRHANTLALHPGHFEAATIAP